MFVAEGMRLATAMKNGMEPQSTSDWVNALVGFLGLAGVLYTGWRASRTEERGQDIEHDANIGQQWQFLTKGMREEIGDLRKICDRQGERIAHLENADRKKKDQIAALMAHIGRLEQALSEWREYALRLVQIIRGLGGTAPDPPIDYSDHE